MEKPEKNENFILDAELVEMISISAFRAALKNGHRLIAYFPRRQRDAASETMNVGDVVKVRMSPYDMSRGEVVLDREM